MTRHLIMLSLAVLSATARAAAQPAGGVRATAIATATANATAAANAASASARLAAAGEPAPPVRPAPTNRKSIMPAEITLERETFSYSGTGRRDPYRSLMTSSDIRPLLSDLRLAVVVLDPDGGSGSVAVLRDTFTKKQYRVRVGQQLGRLRVSAIKPRAVQFTMEEFGYNRTETLNISSDTTKVRNP